MGTLADACMRTSAGAGRVGHCESQESQACLQELEAAAALQRQLVVVQNADQNRQLAEVQPACGGGEARRGGERGRRRAGPGARPVRAGRARARRAARARRESSGRRRCARRVRRAGRRAAGWRGLGTTGARGRSAAEEGAWPRRGARRRRGAAWVVIGAVRGGATARARSVGRRPREAPVAGTGRGTRGRPRGLDNVWSGPEGRGVARMQVTPAARAPVRAPRARADGSRACRGHSHAAAERRGRRGQAFGLCSSARTGGAPRAE